MQDVPLLAVGNQKDGLKEIDNQNLFLVEGKKGSSPILKDHDKSEDKKINQKAFSNAKEEEIPQKLNAFRDKICIQMQNTNKKLAFRKIRWKVVAVVCAFLWLLLLTGLYYYISLIEVHGGLFRFVLNTTREFPDIFGREDADIKNEEKNENKEKEIKPRSDIFRFFIRAQSEKFPELPWRVKFLWTLQPAELVSSIIEYYFEKFTLIDALLRYITEQDCLPSLEPKKKSLSAKPILGTLDERKHSKLICHREKVIEKLFEFYEPTYKRISLLSDVEITFEERRFVKSLVKFLSIQLIRYPISISLLLQPRDTNSLFKLCLKEREEWINYVVGKKVMELNFLPSVLAKHVCAYL